MRRVAFAKESFDGPVGRDVVGTVVVTTVVGAAVVGDVDVEDDVDVDETVVVGDTTLSAPTKSSEFGEPAPISVNAPDVALSLMRDATCAGERFGCDSRMRAAAPATCGAAIDVPLSVAVATSLVEVADVIDEPGANTSRHVPQFE